MQRIFITGASGCVGHYVVEQLAQPANDRSQSEQQLGSGCSDIVVPPYHLYLLVRDRQKLKWPYGFIAQSEEMGSQITLVDGDLMTIEQHANLLGTMDAVIHLAAAWGDSKTAHTINVAKTIELFKLLNPERCRKIIYFSTASLLDHFNQPIPIAGRAGTDYIRSKYVMLVNRHQLPISDRMITLYPTLLFGGGPHYPYSHITAGLKDVIRWLRVVRFLKLDASFHFIHAEDIALIVAYLLQHSWQQPDLVLGNPAMTFNESVAAMCQFYRQPILFRIPVPISFIRLLAVLFRVKLSEWDDYCLKHRHFVHEVVNCDTFRLGSRFKSIEQILSIYT